jgi:hypothetical protein
MTENSTPTVVEILHRNLAPTLQMLSNVIRTCPDEMWNASDEGVPLWQQAYHTLFWLNAWARDWGYKLEYPSFHSDEARDLIVGASPVITKAQMEAYMAKVFSDCEALLETVTLELLTQETEAFGKQYTIADRILGQVRHVQHHVGTMHAILKRKTGHTPHWVGFNE